MKLKVDIYAGLSRLIRVALSRCLLAGTGLLVLLGACRRDAASPASSSLSPLPARCDTLFAEGRRQQQAGSYEAAVGLYRQCLALRTPFSSALSEEDAQALQGPLVRSMVQLLNSYQFMGEPDICAAYFDSLLRSPSPVVDRRFQRDLTSVAAYALSRTERMAEAERCMLEALALPPWHPTPESLFRDYAYAAAVFFSNTTKEDQVVDYCRLALQQAQLSQNLSGQQYVLSMLGMLFKRTGRIDEAISLLEQSIDEARLRSDLIGEVNAYNALTELLLYWQLPQQANSFANRGISLVRSVGQQPHTPSHPVILGQLYGSKGQVMQKLQQPDSAFHYYQLSEQQVSHLPYNSGLADIDLSIGELLAEYPDRPLFQEGHARLRRASAAGTVRTRAAAYYQLARLAFIRHDARRGECCLDSMYQLMHHSPSPFFLSGAYELALNHYLQAGNAPMVMRYAAACLDENRFNADQQNVHKVTDIVVRLQTEVKEAQIRLVEERLRTKTLLYLSIIILVSLLLLIVTLTYIYKRRIYREHQKLLEVKMNQLLTEHQEAMTHWHEERRHSNEIQLQLDQVLSDTQRRSGLEAASLLDVKREGNMNQFEYRFTLLYPQFLQRLRSAVPDVTEREELFCMLVVMRQNSYQISELMDVSPRTVNMMRWRLRKKFHLASSQDSLDEAVLRLATPCPPPAE